MPESPEFIQVRDHGPVRELTLDRPERHNSLTLELTRALLAALDEAAGNGRIRAVLLSANGPSFCSGGDLGEMLAQGDAVADYVDAAMTTAHNPLIARIASFPLPVMAAVQGPAAGAGVGLALAPDLTVAADKASFLLPFVPKLAIVPDAGTSWFLPRGLGYKRAIGHVLTGQALTAAAARDAGLIWDCIPAGSLHEQALALATQLAGLSKGAIHRARRLLHAASHQGLGQQLQMEHALQLDSFTDPAAQEGLAAIREKRPPDFAANESQP